MQNKSGFQYQLKTSMYSDAPKIDTQDKSLYDYGSVPDKCLEEEKIVINQHFTYNLLHSYMMVSMKECHGLLLPALGNSIAL